jgi:HlyD family secretion protein
MPDRSSPLVGHDPTLDLADDRRSPVDRSLWLALLACGGVLLIAFAVHLTELRRVHFATEPARVGDLVVNVTATGTLVPIDQVDIGSELSGTLRSVEVGYNDRVHAGQVLARLDDTRLAAQVLQSKAALDAAKAAVEEARASLAEAESQLGRLQHVREISGGKIPSQQELAAGQATVARARGAVGSAEAQVAQAQATLDVQQTDLSKAAIRSPIDGVVLSATARPGQTVAASLQAPLLFTLAQDLEQLELELSVDEADVGQVREGQTAQFSVDAWPGRTFPGRVRQVRYAAHTVAGVVTYEAILAVDNPDLLLRPGMTATAEIEVKRDDQVLLVPNAALRFEPEGREPAHAGGISALVAGKHSFDVSRGPDAAPRVWALRRGLLEPHDIEAGPSDGTWTEIAAGPVEPGTPLVVAAESRRSS